MANRVIKAADAATPEVVAYILMRDVMKAEGKKFPEYNRKEILTLYAQCRDVTKGEHPS